MPVRDLGDIKLNTVFHYDKIAEKYARLFKDEVWKKDYDRKLLDEFAGKFGANSLLCDVGCGAAGHIGRYLFDKGLNVCGVDISGDSIEIAQKLNPSMKFYVMDIMKLDFSDSSLDGIIVFYSIIHFPKKYMERVFAEFNRVLKKGGRLFLSVHKGESEKILEEVMEEKTSLYMSYFSEIEIIQYMTKGGFSFEFIETRNPYDFEFQTERIYAQAIKKAEI